MLPYSKLTLAEVLNHSRTNYPCNPSIAFIGDDSITYAELSTLVRNTSGLLVTLGIERGDRVAILGENSPAWGIAYFSIVCMGATVVPILPDFSSAEVAKIMEHSEAKAIFVSAKMYPKVNHSSKAGSPEVILLNNLNVVEPGSSDIESISEYNLPENIINIDFSSLNIPEPAEEDLAAIIYTSGTTGRPKGVMLTHKNIISNALSTLQIQDITSKDRFISILPLPHTYECTIGFLMPIMQGASVFYLKKPPTAPVLIPAMQLIKPTMILSVPLVIEKIYKNRILPQLTKSKLGASLYRMPLTRKLLHRIAARKLMKTFGGELRFFGIGGSKLAFEVERFLNEGKFPYSIGYGLTETSPLLTGSAPNLVRFRTAGFSIPGQELMISNPNPETGEGEVLARGANVMLGYYKDEELTHEVFTEDGWFKTGDLGYLDANKYLHLRGRLKNMILGPSGENIYPEDIEGLINSHDLVLDSLVYDLKGRLEAKVHLNYEALETRYAHLKETAIEMQQHLQAKAKEIMLEIRQNVNSKVSNFSKLYNVQEQTEPFEKTPTHKIKRYLYQNKQI